MYLPIVYMGERTYIQKWPIITTVIVGIALIAAAILLDNGGKRQDIWPSVLLEIGASVGLVGILFIVEQSFLRAVKANNQATVERIADIVETANPLNLQDRLTIDVLPTAVDRGQQPKILIRITDPSGDYTTRWSITLRSPSGTTQTIDATWPGAGKIFRARFPTSDSRSGRWSGVAIRNGTEKHEFSATLPS
jgi:hypothetical protein